MLHRYVYSGAVFSHGKMISNNWVAYTYAPSKSKARSNLAYRFKREHGYLPNAKVELIGSVKNIQDTKSYDGEQLSFL
jgi:hypothetical protein